MSEEMMPYNHGEVCEHDKLKRQCDDCRNEWEIARLRKRIAVLQAEVRAWRDGWYDDDASDGELARARAATDAAGALEDC